MSMTPAQFEQLRFPVGQFETPKKYDAQALQGWISSIASFPERVKAAVAGADPTVLSWRYRPDGWMIKQVVHHCADSHLNSLARFKLALTEDSPTIRPYFEARWAELPDGLLDDLQPSHDMLDGIHKRWVVLLNHLSADDLKREFVNPEYGKRFSLAEAIALYSWHCEHHLAHIKQALAAKGTY